MRGIKCAEYIDFLSQMDVVESIVGEDGEDLLVLKIPLGQMLNKLLREVVPPPLVNARELLSWAACALAREILEEREALYSSEDLLSVSSILRAFLSEGIESASELYPTLAREERRLQPRGPKQGDVNDTSGY